MKILTEEGEKGRDPNLYLFILVQFHDVELQ